MTASTNVAPIIIKKKKVSGGDGHHGGAWKVAYADFVTAMMAFFMLMWLLNATTEKQRAGIADYFSPTIAISRASSGGDGVHYGDSVFAQDTLPKNGTGAVAHLSSEGNNAHGLADDSAEGGTGAALKEVEDALMGLGGESLVEENALKHIVTKVTDEGLIIEVFDLPGLPLFDVHGAEPTPALKAIARMIDGVSQAVTNPIAIGGHVRSEPVVVAHSNIWDLSSDRADAMRQLLEGQGMAGERIQRVTGHADREPAVENPMAVRNDRLEIVFLR